MLVSDDAGAGALHPTGVCVVDAAAVDASALLAKALAASHDPVVLVDDAERLAADVAAAVEAVAPRASVVVATTATAVLGAYGGLLGSARAARNGLMLGAVRAGDGEVLGLRIGPAPAGPRGRGRLVTRGRAVAVHVLLPDRDGRPDAAAGPTATTSPTTAAGPTATTSPTTAAGSTSGCHARADLAGV